MILKIMLIWLLIVPPVEIDYAIVSYIVERDIDSVYTYRCEFYDATGLEVYVVMLDTEFPNNPPLRELIETGVVTKVSIECKSNAYLVVDSRYHLTKMEFISSEKTIVVDDSEFMNVWLFIPYIVFFTLQVD